MRYSIISVEVRKDGNHFILKCNYTVKILANGKVKRKLISQTKYFRVDMKVVR